jgi:type IV fimbrial biogenesis protein FimT
MKRIYLGFTLVELLFTIAIIAILTSIAFPSIHQIAYSHQADSAYKRLFSLIQLTRIEAINRQSQVILCPTYDRINCTDDWSQELIVFVDNNNDEKNNEEDPLLHISPKLQSSEGLFWKASGSKRYLRFMSDGATRNQNGRLTYCFKESGNTVHPRQIIVYRSGRIRKGHESKALKQCK